MSNNSSDIMTYQLYHPSTTILAAPRHYYSYGKLRLSIYRNSDGTPVLVLRRKRKQLASSH